MVREDRDIKVLAEIFARVDTKFAFYLHDPMGEVWGGGGRGNLVLRVIDFLTKDGAKLFKGVFNGGTIFL